LDDSILDEFLVDSHEGLDRLDRDLITLEHDPGSRDAIASAFRALHTIKGTCSFFGFRRLESVAHSGESVLSRLRSGRLEPGAEITESLLAVVDAVRGILAGIESTRREPEGDDSGVLARIEPWLEEPRAAREPGLLAPDAPEAAPAPSAVQQHHVRVDVRRLDQIMDLVGELVLARNQLQRTIAPAASPLGAAVQRVDHVTTRLQDEVMRARLEALSPLELVKENAGLLARKIVERTGKTGEHYIANTPSEYWDMWKAALGGGLLIVATAAIKLKITVAGLPPFFEGFLAGTNYAITFLILQALGLALATKQPSMTAATYAKIVRMTQGTERLEKLTEFISRISRTQLAAAVGNLLTVTFGAVLFARAWLYWFSKPYLPASSSAYVYETLNPLASGTVLYAALTGAVLWISALAGGWVENFATYNRIPQAIADHPLGWRFDSDRMRHVANIFERNISAWSTSIVLGYLLGFIPLLGHFFGIPLDVRHVTLSTGTLALAAASLGKGWFYRGWFIHTLFGIGVIFVLNLAVSFGIASWVAFRAYDVSYADRVQLLKYVVKSFFRSPLRFLFSTRGLSGPH